MHTRPTIVTDEQSLRAEYEPPADLVLQKCKPCLDAHFREFIAHSPFLCLATADVGGTADVSPRGDAPGFVLVVDDAHLLVPDRRGNNRLDSMSNITRNPHVALIFFVPGVDETLRVNGTAQIVRNGQDLQRLAAHGKTPHTGILVEVHEAFFQCGKALKRAKLWCSDAQIARHQLGSFGNALADQTQTKMTPAEIDQLIEESYKQRLY